MNTPNSPIKSFFDLVIIGASYTGLTLSIALKQAIPQLQILLIDKEDDANQKKDVRAFALTPANITMLMQLNLWESFSQNSQAIQQMIITDSRTKDPIRPPLLTFSTPLPSQKNASSSSKHDSLAYMIEASLLKDALCKKVEELGGNVIKGEEIGAFHYKEHSLLIPLPSCQKEIETKLLVAATGGTSSLRKKAGIKMHSMPYNQTGIVCIIEHEKDHKGRAIQHFLPSGPLALLPLKGKRSAVVWNEPPASAHELIKASEDDFIATLAQRVTPLLGNIALASSIQSFPFSLRLARDFVKPRFALLGDAAHSIHPISGQGLNLGLYDVAALSEAIVDHKRIGLDIGSQSCLSAYQSNRWLETFKVAKTTHFLNKLFSNDITPLRMVRDVGLGIVDRSEFIKRYFIHQASGPTKHLPRLLKGQAL